MSEMVNLEVKFRDVNLDEIAQRLERLMIPPAHQEHQVDIYFGAPTGRLKLRIIDDEAGYLIAYDRPGDPAIRPSRYALAPLGEPPEAVAEVLALSLGERGRVVKERVIYLHGNTRIHLDQVEGLGSFVEFEAVLDEQPEHDHAASTARLAWLTERLGLSEAATVDVGYADLLNL